MSDLDVATLYKLDKMAFPDQPIPKKEMSEEEMFGQLDDLRTKEIEGKIADRARTDATRSDKYDPEGSLFEYRDEYPEFDDISTLKKWTPIYKEHYEKAKPKREEFKQLQDRARRGKISFYDYTNMKNEDKALVRDAMSSAEVGMGVEESLAHTQDPMSELPFVGGVNEGLRLWDVKKAAENLDLNRQGKVKLTPEQIEDYQNKVREYVDFNDYTTARGSTFAGNVAKGVRDSLSLALEFLATGGTVTAARVGTQKAALKALEKLGTSHLRTLLVKMAAKGAGAAAYVAAQAVRRPGAVVEEFAKKKMPEFTVDDKGDVTVTKQGAGTLSALRDALLTAGAENLAESSGEVVLRGVGKTLAKVPGGQRMMNGMYDLWKDTMPDIPFSKFVSTQFQRAGIQGMPAEWTEERIDPLLKAAVGVGNWGDAIPDKEQLQTELAVLAVPGMARHVSMAVVESVAGAKSSSRKDIANALGQEPEDIKFSKEEREAAIQAAKDFISGTKKVVVGGVKAAGRGIVGAAKGLIPGKNTTEAEAVAPEQAPVQPGTVPAQPFDNIEELPVEPTSETGGFVEAPAEAPVETPAPEPDATVQAPEPVETTTPAPETSQEQPTVQTEEKPTEETSETYNREERRSKIRLELEQRRALAQKPADEMTLEELRALANTDPKTGAKSAKAWSDKRKKNPKPIVGMFDIGGLKWVNDNKTSGYGYSLGDRLLQDFTTLAAQEGIDIYRSQGSDEFYTEWDSQKDFDDAKSRLDKLMEGHTLQVVDDKGNVVDYIDLIASGASGVNEDEAGQNLGYAKQGRGFERGERPIRRSGQPSTPTEVPDGTTGGIPSEDRQQENGETSGGGQTGTVVENVGAPPAPGAPEGGGGTGGAVPASPEPGGTVEAPTGTAVPEVTRKRPVPSVGSTIDFRHAKNDPDVGRIIGRGFDTEEGATILAINPDGTYRVRTTWSSREMQAIDPIYFGENPIDPTIKQTVEHVNNARRKSRKEPITFDPNPLERGESGKEQEKPKPKAKAETPAAPVDDVKPKPAPVKPKPEPKQVSEEKTDTKEDLDEEIGEITPEQWKLVTDYLEGKNNIIKSKQRQWKNAIPDENASYGVAIEALTAAAKSWDKSKGPFENYANRSIAQRFESEAKRIVNRREKVGALSENIEESAAIKGPSQKRIAERSEIAKAISSSIEEIGKENKIHANILRIVMNEPTGKKERKTKSDYRKTLGVNATRMAELQQEAFESLKKKLIAKGIENAEFRLDDGRMIDLVHEATWTGEPVGPQDVIKKATELFPSLAIRYGVERKTIQGKKVAGLTKTNWNTIQLRHANAGDLITFTHELAHYINGKGYLKWSGIGKDAISELGNLDYDQQRKDIREGFAEYLSYRMTGDDAKTRAPKFDAVFEKMLKENPVLDAKLSELQGLISLYRSQGSEARIAAAIAEPGETITQDVVKPIERTILMLKERFDDDLTWLEKHAREAEKNIGVLKPGADPYKAASVMLAFAGSISEDAVKSGVTSLVTGNRLSGGIVDALSKIPENEMAQFVRYLYARHALDVWKTGRNPGITKGDAQQVFDKYNQRSGYEEASDSLTKWNKALVRMYAEIGGLSPEAEKLILESFPNYIPLKRAIGTTGGIGKSGGKPVQKMSKEGSGAPIIDPIVSMVLSAQRFYGAGVKLEVAKKIVAVSEQAGMGQWVQEEKQTNAPVDTTLAEIKKQLKTAGLETEGLTQEQLDTVLTIFRPSKSRTGENTVTFWKDGKEKTYRIQPDLYRALHEAPTDPDTKLLLAALRPATALVRLGATGLRPSFTLGFNILRDLVTGSIQAKGSAGSFLMGTFKNFATVAKSKLGEMTNQKDIIDPFYDLFQRYGGQMSGFVGQDIRKAYEKIPELMKEAHANKIAISPSGILRATQEIFSIGESGPRLTQFEMILKKHGFTAADLKAGKTPSMDLIIEAMLAAHNVTTNFHRAGSVMRKMNTLKAYSNAAYQGIRQPLQRAKEDPQRFAIRSLSSIIIPALAMWWWRKDDDDYRELPPWQRFSFWNFKGGWKVPRPQGTYWLMGAMVEAFADDLYRQNPERTKQLFAEMIPEWGDVATSFVPDAILPAIETVFNYDSFRRQKIVRENVENLLPKDQYYDYTTAASKFLGDILNVSPAKIDHLIANYSGGLGTDILKIPEQGTLKATGYGRFTYQPERGESINQFYEAKKAAMQEKGSDALREKPDPIVVSENYRMTVYGNIMTALNNASRETKDKKQTAKYNSWKTGIARVALRKEPLSEYPNPVKEIEKLPEPVAEEIDKQIMSIMKHSESSAPSPKIGEQDNKYERRVQEWEAKKGADELILRELGLSEESQKEEYATQR